MGQFIAGTKTIASVYPLKPMPIRRLYAPDPRGGTSVFEIGACPRGSKPTTLVVSDSWEAYRDPMRDNEQSPNLITAERISDDLVRDWKSAKLSDAASGLGPGIWVCAGDEPSKEEIAANTEMQRHYFEELYMKAQELVFRNEFAAITDTHRAAATWLGKTDSWVKGLVQETDLCPLCKQQVAPGAPICPNGHFLRELNDVEAAVYRRTMNHSATNQAPARAVKG